MKVLDEPCFFDKIEGCVMQACSFIVTLVHHRLFSPKTTFSFFILLKKAGLFQKESVVSSLYSKLAV